ncbi:MAG: tol-pal system-associated acyl-CoA thioesterase [Betaproteobacteria bacterium]|nr:tol-pal system-associated acyl-CoA thioesterase [Betaproteobacteria bacterium]
MGSRFAFPVRVYYEDTDAAGVVYYANYLRYLERARTEWLAALGHPLAPLEREHGVVFVVRRAEIDFRRPARLGDALDVGLVVESLSRASLVARQDVRRGAEVLVDARVELACVDAAHWKPTRIPIPLPGAQAHAP